jgi:hypothetical protein
MIRQAAPGSVVTQTASALAERVVGLLVQRTLKCQANGNADAGVRWAHVNLSVGDGDPAQVCE